MSDPPDEILDAVVENVRVDTTYPVPAPEAQLEARDAAMQKDATTALALRAESALYGSPQFFARAAEELLASTQHGLELAGAAFAKKQGGRTVLVGLMRNTTGQPGRVGIDPDWGSILWHTHPGLRGSLAAFSIEDLDVAKRSQKPLLVIGFGGLSPDVLSTLTLPFGLRAFVASAGLKGLLALEKHGVLRDRLLRLGVAARVCWPSGVIQPVLRRNATPLEAALDEMSFALDRGVGAVERLGQQALRDVLALLTGQPPR
ncbi:MAG TPA: hypothetical protein VGO62_02270 [Myxococcota bacterium]|jgi:hypothetical protein